MEQSPDPGSISGFTNLFPLPCLVLALRFSFSRIQLSRLRFLLVMAPFAVLSIGFRTFFLFRGFCVWSVDSLEVGNLFRSLLG